MVTLHEISRRFRRSQLAWIIAARTPRRLTPTWPKPELKTSPGNPNLENSKSETTKNGKFEKSSADAGD